MQSREEDYENPNSLVKGGVLVFGLSEQRGEGHRSSFICLLLDPSEASHCMTVQLDGGTKC
jgi:hypothetical protein